MPQNRTAHSSKGQRSKTSHITLLKDNLMSKFNETQLTKTNYRLSSSQKTSKFDFLSQLQDFDVISFDTNKKPTMIERPKSVFQKTKQTERSKYVLQKAKQIERPKSVLQKAKQIERPKSVLQKAKQITRINKEQIESAKKAYKKSNPQIEGMFLTGCGLYRAQDEPTEFIDDFESVNLNDALKFLVSHQKDDLEELRKMIKKTNSNIKEYSHEVTKTTGHVQNAADLFERDFNIDLKVKINRCKPIERQFQTSRQIQTLAKRKISTSGNCRNKGIF